LSDQSPNSIALVILALNEEEGLEKTYNRFKEIFTRLKLEHEIFIVNDGSTDRTGEIANNITEKDRLVTVFHNKSPMGMGFGYKQGLKKATKEYYMYTGAYDAQPSESIISFLNGMGKFDIITGYIVNTEVRPPNRRIFSSLFTLLMNGLTGLNLKYYNAMDIARTRCLKFINIQSNGYTWQAECIAKLVLKKSCTYQHIPMTIQHRGKSQSNAVKPKNFLDVGKFLIFLACDVIAFRLRQLRK
jgi:glycosyltransferase involved in cell wall biosynthesis